MISACKFPGLPRLWGFHGYGHGMSNRIVISLHGLVRILEKFLDSDSVETLYTCGKL